ncbi:MAG: Ig-like domain-containing protein, partial [Planctomycetia bacterium]
PGSPTTPDLTAATDTGRSNTDNITSNNTPVFQGIVDVNSTAQAGDFVEIYSGTTLVGVGTVVLDANSGNLVWSVTVGTTASGYTLNTIPAGTVLADGTQAISAMFRTPGGFGSQLSQALTVVVDTTAPNAPSSAPDLAASSDTGTSSTDNLTNDTTPTFTGTGGVPGDTVNLYANGTLVGTAIVAPDGSYSVSASPALTDGTYAFTTKYADLAGNLSSASSTTNVTIDSTPPAVPPTPDLVATDDTGASNFDNLTSVNQPTFVGFGTTGDTIKIYVDGVLAGTTIVDTNGNWSITTNSIADGVHQITSQAIDPAGNFSAQSTPLVLTIDSSAPNSPIFTTPSGPTSNSQPPISGTGEPGSTITLYDGTTPIGTTIVNANGTWNITPISPLAEGSHTFTTTATDAAGNISLPSSPIAVTIDTVNPLPPVVASVSDDTGNPSDKITSDNQLTITGTAEPGSTITVYDSSSGSPVAVGTVVVGANGIYSVTTSTLTDGSHPLSITSTDAAGNESQPAAVGTYTVDTGTPTLPTVSSVSQDTGASAIDKITNDNTLTIAGLAGSAEAGTTITVYDSSSGSPVAVGTAIVQPDGSYSITTSVLSDGNHPLTITSTDTAGNQSSPTSLGTWAIDTAAPNAPAFGSVTQDTGVSATDKITSDNTLTISGAAGSAEPGTTITVYDNGTPVGTAIVAADGSYSVTTSVLSNGTHPLSITATDTAGNQSSPTSLGAWTIDTVAPTSPVVTSVSDDTGASATDKITSDNTLTVAGTAEPNSLVTIYAYIDNSDPNIPDTIRVVVGTGYADANGNYAVTTNPLADNALNEKYVLSVTATDPAGMESPATSIGAWAISTTIPNPPVVTSVSEDTGSSSTDKLTNDTTLTVTGTGTPGTTITIYDGITPVGTGLVDANGNYSVTTSALADGPHALSVSATNPFGFEGLSTQLGTWTVDTVDPIQPTLTANNGLPQVTGTADPGTTVSVVIGGATYTTPVDQNGNWTINLVTDIPASGTAPAINTGTFPISVYSTDAAGNPTTPTSSNLVVTTTVQPPPIFTSNPTTSDTTPLITGNSEIGSTITLILTDPNNNNAVIATYSNVPTTSAGTWSVNLQTAIPDGGTTPIAPLVNGNSYNLSATATDANNQFTSVA